jgi:hypothetical protein
MKMQKALVKTVGFAALLAAHVMWAAEAAAQQPPPIQGVTGTIATETSIDDTTSAGQHSGQLCVLRERTKHGLIGDAAGGSARRVEEGTRVVVRRGKRVQEGHRSSPHR